MRIDVEVDDLIEAELERLSHDEPASPRRVTGASGLIVAPTPHRPAAMDAEDEVSVELEALIEQELQQFAVQEAARKRRDAAAVTYAEARGKRQKSGDMGGVDGAGGAWSTTSSTSTSFEHATADELEAYVLELEAGRHDAPASPDLPVVGAS